METSQIVRRRLTAADPEAAREVIGRLYGGTRLRVGTDAAWRPLRIDSSAAGGVRVDRLQFGLPVRAVTGPLDHVLVSTAVRGSAVFRHGSRSATARRGQPVLMPTGVELESRTSADFTEYLVPLPMALLAEHAASGFGLDPADLRFEATAPVSAARALHWSATVAHVLRQLEAPDSALAHPLVQAQTVALLAAAALVTFPNTTMTAVPAAAGGRVPPAVVRRAVAHLEAHAHEPLALSDVAAAAGIGVRGLQHAFVRHLGTTPTAHLRRVRLQRAHQELLAAEPSDGTTVAAVAARWGFASPGAFTTAYRGQFGRLPSTTLRS